MTKPVIVLDLDDTIVSCTLIRSPDFSFTIKVGKNKKAYVKLRPGLHEFLKDVSIDFEVFFFTASLKFYANQIIDVIAPGTPSNHRFYKCSCKNLYGYLVKDLSIISRPLNRIILVDDINGSALLQPENIINISPWNGDKNDNVLLGQLLPMLTRIAEEKNLSLAFKQIIHQENDNYSDLRSFI